MQTPAAMSQIPKNLPKNKHSDYISVGDIAIVTVKRKRKNWFYDNDPISLLADAKFKNIIATCGDDRTLGEGLRIDKIRKPKTGVKIIRQLRIMGINSDLLAERIIQSKELAIDLNKQKQGTLLVVGLCGDVFIYIKVDAEENITPLTCTSSKEFSVGTHVLSTL